jgi:hypothetical protein
MVDHSAAEKSWVSKPGGVCAGELRANAMKLRKNSFLMDAAEKRITFHEETRPEQMECSVSVETLQMKCRIPTFSGIVRVPD